MNKWNGIDTAPWGTPLLSFLPCENDPFNLTLCFLSFKQLLLNKITSSLIYLLCLEHIFLTETQGVQLFCPMAVKLTKELLLRGIVESFTGGAIMYFYLDYLLTFKELLFEHMKVALVHLAKCDLSDVSQRSQANQVFPRTSWDPSIWR